jgi:hypothetical protein
MECSNMLNAAYGGSAAGPAAAASCEHQRGIELSAPFTAARRSSGDTFAGGKRPQPRSRPGMIVQRSRWLGVVWAAVGRGKLIETSPSRLRRPEPHAAPRWDHRKQLVLVRWRCVRAGSACGTWCIARGGGVPLPPPPTHPQLLTTHCIARAAPPEFRTDARGGGGLGRAPAGTD